MQTENVGILMGSCHTYFHHRSTSCHYSIKGRGRDETQECIRDQEEVRDRQLTTIYLRVQKPELLFIHILKAKPSKTVSYGSDVVSVYVSVFCKHRSLGKPSSMSILVQSWQIYCELFKIYSFLSTSQLISGEALETK